jgi:DNA-directed RNA polymerase subunit RPC12/RpoP
MNLTEFYKEYPDEKSCKEKFKQMRIETGIKCKKCSNTTHYWHKTREEFQCKKCGHRIGLRSGTVMHSSKLPFHYWFLAMHLITSTKKSFSAKEIQRQLGHKRYEPIWTLMHKLRLVMGLRDERYSLSDEIELDEGYFSTVNLEYKKKDKLKRGKGSQKKMTVLIMAQSEEIEDEKQKKDRPNRKVSYIKMKVIQSVKSEQINQKVDESVEKESTIITDSDTSHLNLKEVVENVQLNVVNPKEAGKILPWVHIAISNAKRLFLDIYHHIDKDFLQSYLNEFCYKFNRRYNEKMFDRLLVACVSYRWNFLGDVNG